MPSTPHAPHALVTGVAAVSADAIAASLARQGMTVTVAWPAARGAGPGGCPATRISPMSPTVAVEASIAAAIARAAERQPIDILVANAGAAESRRLQK